MQITFYGAARTTTGSMHLLELDGSRLLLDCGLYQGKRKEAFERNRNLPLDATSIDQLVLSHAHIDHSGNIPSLVKSGFDAPILCTPATKDLCEIMLLDSAYLQVKDVEYVNKKREKQGKKPFEPLYEADDVQKALQHFEPVPYDSSFNVASGVKLRFVDAGHILGAGFTILDVEEEGVQKRILYTGDIGRRHMPILRDPVVVSDVDILITESTYGDRLHPPQENVKQQLQELCDKIIQRRSRLIIPAFSVGRTQQLLYLLYELNEEGRIPELPVYVDSPLSTKATRVHRDHPECYNSEMMQLIGEHGHPFSMQHVNYVTDVEQSKKLNDADGPIIIISASGMCEGGRILHHLKHSIEDERHIILIVGFQAEHTLGRRLVQKDSPIKIYGDPYELKAEVHSIQALSAHADYEEMLEYFNEMGPQGTRAFVVHGDPDQQEPFANRLRDIGMHEVLIPDRGETFTF
ncbi:MAG: MBL fold metallo-hydrolase RNA specificity domain-containing protein [Candidatus Brocadiia bacterium]